MNDADVQALWRAGSLRAWVRVLIAVASVLTIALAVVGARLMWITTRRHGVEDPFWYRNLPAIVVAGTLALAAIIPARTSRWIRVAVVLPVAQIVAMLVTWRLWSALETGATMVPLMHRLPIAVVLVSFAVIYGGVAFLVARGRERLHAVVMLALANLLLLGLWLPIASRLWCGETAAFGTDFVHIDHQLDQLVPVMVLPPLAAAIAFTVLRFRRRQPPSFRTALIVLVACALAASVGRWQLQDYTVDQFLHVLLAVAVLAVAALAVLAASIALDTFRARRRLVRGVTGVIRCDEAVAGAVTIASWLRGPRQMLAPFAIATPQGDIPIPGGARWVGPLPPATTLLRQGEAAVVLRPGDPVVASGFVAPDAGDPFRSSRAWIPGDGEIVIGRVEDVRAPADIGLALWRPSVAYLTIVIAVGVPGLVAGLFAL